MSKRLALAVALICAALPIGSAASKSTPAPAHATIGIAEQLPGFFADSRFTALKVTHARIDLAWDVLVDKGQAAAANAYMQAAHRDGIDVLVTFDHSRRPGRASVNPTTSQFVTQLKAMRKRWPWVHEFSTWNEVNINKSYKYVAKWWLALRAACPTCTVLGGDLLDRSTTSDSPAATKASIDRWIKGFLHITHGRQPTAWGLHNYIDANKARTSGTRAMLAAVKGKVWFTETGGLVARSNGSKFKLAQGQTHATATTKFILTKLAAVSSRVQRVYLYQWSEDTKTWDSAFVNSRGQARSSLTYLRKHLTGH